MQGRHDQRVLLIADGDAAVARPLARYFELAGYDVAWVRTGGELLERLASGGRVDVALVDLGLTDRDGRDLCLAVRSLGYEAGLVAMTVHDDELTVVNAFQSGADDVVTKPLRLAETRARIDHLVRRFGAPDGAHRFSGLSLDARARRVAYAGVEIPLGVKEIEALSELMQSPGRVVLRDHLLQRVWGAEQPSAKAVDALIARLRGKLAGAGANVVITAVRGSGWRLDTMAPPPAPDPDPSAGNGRPAPQRPDRPRTSRGG